MRDNNSPSAFLLSHRCHAHNTNYLKALIIKVWQRDDVTTVKEQQEKSQILQILYRYNWLLRYNKGVSWHNKDASWQPYCIFKRNKDIHIYLYLSSS